MSECKCKNCSCKKIEHDDFFNTREFKNLPWYRRMWERFITAFFQTINMF